MANGCDFLESVLQCFQDSKLSFLEKCTYVNKLKENCKCEIRNIYTQRKQGKDFPNKLFFCDASRLQFPDAQLDRADGFLPLRLVDSNI